MTPAMLPTGASAPASMVAHHLPAAQQRSPWHSPVPYLFGGLAAMLGLIAFALLLLACSYWKLSGYLEGGNGRDGNGDLESGEGKHGNAGDCKNPAFPPEQRIVVIMAGDDKPSFLATPMSSRASSFADKASKGKGCHEECNAEGEKTAEAEPGGDAESLEHQEQNTHENPVETESRQNQNQLQALEETHESLDRNQ